MHIRKITKEGRVNIPVEIMKMYDLKENDRVVINSVNDMITIKKFSDCYTCSVTGKVHSSPLHKIGEAFISEEGIKQVKDYLQQYEF